MNKGINRINGFDMMLTVAEVAAIIRKPARFVREQLIRPGILKAIKFGGNSYRIRPSDLARMLETGPAGFRHVRGSGGRRS